MIADVTLVCATRGQTAGHAIAAPTACQIVGTGVFEGEPPGRTDAGVVDWLRENAATDTFDAALLLGPSVGGYAGRLSLPTVWDLVDDQTLAFWRSARRQRPLRALQELRYALAWRRYEREVASRCARTVLISSADARFARRWVSRSPIDVVPNGVDADHFAPDERIRRRPGRLVFVGVMDFRPNTDAACWFVRRVWPRLRAELPKLELRIVGPDPTSDVTALSELPGVTVTGRVPDVRDELRSASAAIAPMRIGGGMKNKILEAWACGTPVIASPLALAGLTPAAREASLAPRTVDEWVRAARHLTTAPKIAAEIGERGRCLVVDHYSWQRSAASMLDVLERAVRS